MSNTTIMSGKVNFNTKEAKSFRDTLAIWHIFDFEVDDMRAKKRAEIRNAQGIIATNRDLIANNRFAQHDQKYYEDQIAQMEQAISDSKERLQKWESEQIVNVSKVESIFTKNLYLSYVKSLSEKDGAWRVSEYTEKIAGLLSENGLVPAWDTLESLYYSVREDKGTGSTKAETGSHNKPFSEKKWRAIFMGKLCGLMGNTLPTYKFRNILTKAEKKALKKSAK